jgi:hypothetical protein
VLLERLLEALPVDGDVLAPVARPRFRDMDLIFRERVAVVQAEAEVQVAIVAVFDAVRQAVCTTRCEDELLPLELLFRSLLHDP